MDIKQTGGTAFPHQTSCGMSLRDYIAIKALAALISTRNHHYSGEEGPEIVAVDAYMVADAMLAERAK